jgi:transposase
MDAIDELKQDVREGRIGAEALIDLIADLCRKLEAAQKRIEEFEKELGRRPTAKLDEPFSTRAEEQRQEARGKKKRQRKPKGRRGRLSTDDKVTQAERTGLTEE